MRLDELIRSSSACRRAPDDGGRRKETKREDLAKLYEVLESARSPTGAEIGEIHGEVWANHGKSIDLTFDMNLADFTT